MTLQLGNGCSATAVRGGLSIDTSMGLTPLEGLMMGTRSGNVDPSLVGHLVRRGGMSLEEVERCLNTQCGLLGVSGLSGDMRTLLEAERQGHEWAALSIEMYCHRVRQYVGAYLAIMGGADAIVFGGGIGENSPQIRERICAHMSWCGLTVNPERNLRAVGREGRISADGFFPMSIDRQQQTENLADVAGYLAGSAAAQKWASGYGAILHTDETQARVIAMASVLQQEGVRGVGVELFELLHAADRVASAGMWLVVHQTYARNVYLDGRPLAAEDFKPKPEGHTGGSLNMVPAYTGYLAANALTGTTRAWIMGQGHCVSAIDSLNLLVDNMTAAHATRYSVDDEGLSRFVRDFYSYQFRDDGHQDSPLGSHVNAHTAGGLAEGGYLGFVELQYVHMPLPGERLVAFLSDGAFEEQRGSDWIPRWWRAEDCGLVTPVMIKNGRRIDQRTTLAQSGGADWFVEHLKLNGFDPIVFDGRDPAAFVWAIWEMERRLEVAASAIRTGAERYPVRLPYGIAVAPKGAGFYGEGTNLAHNLPLMANPARDAEAAQHFNESCRRLWVPIDELRTVPLVLTSHTWENSKNELSHQDPALAESMLGETSDISRVDFVPDFNTAAAVVQEVFQTHGQIWSVVVPKAEVIADLFTPDEARRLFEQGAILLDWAGHDPQRASLVLTAVGAYR